MWHPGRFLRTLLPAVLLACAAPCRFGIAAGYKWKLDTYVSYASGDYGEDKNTAILYWPVVAKRVFSQGEVGLTLPYVRISSPGSQVLIDGAVETIGDGTETGTRTHSGLGDMIIKGEYALKEADETWPWIDVFAKLKLPTADDDKGLGTGEADFGIGLESVKRLQDDYLAFFDIAYTVIGDPSGVDYDNRWMISPGIGRYYTPDFMLAAFYEWRNAIGSGDDPHGVSFLAYHKWRPNLNGYAMLDFGLSNGAADVGFIAGLQWRL